MGIRQRKETCSCRLKREEAPALSRDGHLQADYEDTRLPEKRMICRILLNVFHADLN